MIESDYTVRLVDLPPSIGGMVTPNDDVTFNIYINARLAIDQQQKAMKHELEHIKHDDFYNAKSINEIERID